MLVDTLLKKSLIREEDRAIIVEMTAWLINRYGLPKAARVPSPLHPSPSLKDVVFEGNNAGHFHDWSLETFDYLKSECGRDDWCVQLFPQSRLSPNLHHLVYAKNWSLNATDPYRLDNYGRPVINFDPISCTTPGAFALNVILKLSEIQLMNFCPHTPVSPTTGAMVLLASAAYLGQGFNLLSLTDLISRELSSKDGSVVISKRIVEDALIFGASLNLMALNRAPEQIIAAYGKMAPQKTRKKIHFACRQISRAEQDLKLLKVCVNASRSSQPKATGWAKTFAEERLRA